MVRLCVLFSTVARATQHKNNILHLNLSPGNVIVNGSNTSLKVPARRPQRLRMWCLREVNRA